MVPSIMPVALLGRRNIKEIRRGNSRGNQWVWTDRAAGVSDSDGPRGGFDVVGINDITDTKTLATLLKYDSIAPPLRRQRRPRRENLIVNGKKIRATGDQGPRQAALGRLGGRRGRREHGHFHRRAADGKSGYDTHLDAGAKKVVLSAPAKDEPDLTCVLGVNDDKLTPAMKCISNASCTTNCLAPVAKVLHEKFGIEKGLMTTVHAYTNDQRVLDLPHSDPYRARRRRREHHSHHAPAPPRPSGLVIPELQGQADRHFAPRAGADRQRGRPDGR